MYLIESCVENFTDIPAKITNGAKRIELCDNLAVGGTTVSKGVMAESINYAHEKNIPVMTIIRPRGGDFVYNDLELKMMEADIFQAQQLGADGVVLGCLTADGHLDEEALEMLLGAADGLLVTFHMAFDALKDLQTQYAAIDWLVEHHVKRILTHGGPAATPIIETLPQLAKLIAYAAGRLIILPGGGLNPTNVTEVVDTLQVKEVHGTKIV